MKPHRPPVLERQDVEPRTRPALTVVREPALKLPASTRDGWRRTRALGAGLAVVAVTLALAYGISLLARTN